MSLAGWEPAFLRRCHDDTGMDFPLPRGLVPSLCESDSTSSWRIKRYGRRLLDSTTSPGARGRCSANHTSDLEGLPRPPLPTAAAAVATGRKGRRASGFTLLGCHSPVH
ncbi:unnamed protein product [Lota lota]